MDGKQESKGSDSFLPSGQIVHGPEPLAGRHTVVVHSVQVRFFRVLRAQETLGTLVSGQSLHSHVSLLLVLTTSVMVYVFHTCSSVNVIDETEITDVQCDNNVNHTFFQSIFHAMCKQLFLQTTHL